MYRLILKIAPALLMAASFLCGCCGASFEAATPAGFVELEDQKRYDYRATSADGLVMAVREIEHEPKGEVAFWTRAIENQMRQRGGYALLESRDVENVQGVRGKRLRFGHDEGGKPHYYDVTLYPTTKTLYLLEAGGKKELMERHAAQIDWAIKNFRVD
jgi:hypothetical protein